MCSLRGVKSLCDVTLWMLWAEKGKVFYPRKACVVLLGRRWVLQVRVPVLSPVSCHGEELGKLSGVTHPAKIPPERDGAEFFPFSC